MIGLEMKYFVLSPSSGDREHATASRIAMRAYADSIETSNPILALQLRAWAMQAFVGKNRTEEPET